MVREIDGHSWRGRHARSCRRRRSCRRPLPPARRDNPEAGSRPCPKGPPPRPAPGQGLLRRRIGDADDAGAVVSAPRGSPEPPQPQPMSSRRSPGFRRSLRQMWSSFCSCAWSIVSVAGAEIGAGIDEVAVEPEPVEVVRDVVMADDVGRVLAAAVRARHLRDDRSDPLDEGRAADPVGEVHRRRRGCLPPCRPPRASRRHRRRRAG